MAKRKRKRSAAMQVWACGIYYGRECDYQQTTNISDCNHQTVFGMELCCCMAAQRAAKRGRHGKSKP